MDICFSSLAYLKFLYDSCDADSQRTLMVVKHIFLMSYIILILNFTLLFV